MNCFYHPDKVAIGICKACNKGLCIECAADLGHGIACKDKHETEVENLNMIVSRSTKIYSSAPKDTLIVPIFYFFMGAVFASFGYFSGAGITDFAFILGLGFMVFSIVTFLRNRAIFNNKEQKE